MSKFSSLAFKFLKMLVRLFYPKTEIVGAENLPDEACIVVGNHAQMNGPIVSELYFPRRRYTWCAYQMMELKEVPAYAYQDFWSHKPDCIHWFYRLLSYIIAPLSVCVFNNAKTIPVYHDTRLLTTLRQTLQHLEDGADIVIFPEHSVPHNHILCDFQDKFIDVAKLYHKKTGRELCFVPMYLAPALKKAYLGKPIRFDHSLPIKQERERIRTYLMDEISSLAISLPRHKVVPYNNISKRLYNWNKDE